MSGGHPQCIWCSAPVTLQRTVWCQNVSISCRDMAVSSKCVKFRRRRSRFYCHFILHIQEIVLCIEPFPHSEVSLHKKLWLKAGCADHVLLMHLHGETNAGTQARGLSSSGNREQQYAWAQDVAFRGNNVNKCHINNDASVLRYGATLFTWEPRERGRGEMHDRTQYENVVTGEECGRQPGDRRRGKVWGANRPQAPPPATCPHLLGPQMLPDAKHTKVASTRDAPTSSLNWIGRWGGRGIFRHRHTHSVLNISRYTKLYGNDKCPRSICFIAYVSESCKKKKLQTTYCSSNMLKLQLKTEMSSRTLF